MESEHLPFAQDDDAGPTAATGIGTDLPCIMCGYNLRGLSAEGRCPECGDAIPHTIQANYLQFADPAWLTTLRRGVLLLIVAAVLEIIIFFLTRVIGSESAHPGVSLLGRGLVLAGVVLITRPEPRTNEAEKTLLLRRALVLTATIAFICVGVQLGMMAVRYATLLMNNSAPAAAFMALSMSIIMWAQLPLAVASFATFVALLLFLRRLALRVPNRGLAGHTRGLLWCLVLAYGTWWVVVLMMLAMMTLGHINLMAGMGVSICVAKPLNIVILSLLLFYVVLLFRYHGALRTALGMARHKASRVG